MTEDTRTPADVLADFFPESAEAVALLLQCVRIGGQPVAEGEDDGRLDAIRDLLDATTAPIRTRVVVIAEVLRELAGTVRMAALQAKADAGDADVSEGHAEVTPDGWLVVYMGEKEIGRVPFNPRRQDGTENKLATDIIAEYVRLHVNGALESANVTKLPAPGRRTSVAVIDDKTADAVTGAAGGPVE